VDLLELGPSTESTRGLGADLWRGEGGGAVIDVERESWE
jgi:hypothetical protein